MPENQLTPQQLFSLSRKTLEKRTADFYQESHDEKATIKLLIALQVRDELGESDFAFFLKDLVRHLFMRTKTTRALRRYAVYFKDYFEKRNGGYYHCGCWRSRRSLLRSSKACIPKLSKNH